MSEIVTLYSDGSTRTNPGVGGWAAVLCYGEHQRELSGGSGRTTNNRMELAAVIEGLRALTRPCRVKIISDSQYIVHGINVWFPQWFRDGHTEVPSRKVMNRDLWNILFGLAQVHGMRAEWVRGHAKEDNLNNRAHDLAKSTAIQYETEVNAVFVSDIGYDLEEAVTLSLSLS